MEKPKYDKKQLLENLRKIDDRAMGNGAFFIQKISHEDSTFFSDDCVDLAILKWVAYDPDLLDIIHQLAAEAACEGVRHNPKPDMFDLLAENKRLKSQVKNGEPI